MEYLPQPSAPPPLGGIRGPGTSQGFPPSSSKLDRNVMIKSRWRLTKKIGQGAFGEIFEATDVTSNEIVAIKFERWDSKRAVLKLEVAVLKKLQGFPCATRYIHCGHWDEFNYLVMELLGDNLTEFRRLRPTGCFSLPTTLRLGIQVIRAIEAIHGHGYLHRDIKPSNFAMGLSGKRKEECVMFDYGLTRKFRLPSGEVRPPREVAGFRGTARYASINSHLSKELGPRDDLWSVLYMLIEFVTGSLPWRKVKDKEEIGLLKIRHNNLELVRGLPAEFQVFMEHLQVLDYHSTPDYAMLCALFEQSITKQCGSPHCPYDWETADSALTQSASVRARYTPMAVDSGTGQQQYDAEDSNSVRYSQGMDSSQQTTHSFSGSSSLGRAGNAMRAPLGLRVDQQQYRTLNASQLSVNVAQIPSLSHVPLVSSMRALGSNAPTSAADKSASAQMASQRQPIAGSSAPQSQLQSQSQPKSAVANGNGNVASAAADRSRSGVIDPSQVRLEVPATPSTLSVKSTPSVNSTAKHDGPPKAHAVRDVEKSDNPNPGCRCQCTIV